MKKTQQPTESYRRKKEKGKKLRDTIIGDRVNHFTIFTLPKRLRAQMQMIGEMRLGVIWHVCEKETRFT